MLVRVRSATVLGVQALPVEVEVESAEGLPFVRVVGLASGAVQDIALGKAPNFTLEPGDIVFVPDSLF